jgi:hypothetical protein
MVASGNERRVQEDRRACGYFVERVLIDPSQRARADQGVLQVDNGEPEWG